MRSHPRRVYAKMPRKYLNQCWVIPSALFVAAVALQNKFPLSSKIFKKSWEHAKDVYTFFVDLGKVYGRVRREKLSGALREYGVDGCLLLAVK